MNPSSRLAASLVSSLLLAWPALEACIAGTAGLEWAVLRWAAALAVAWIAFSVIGRLIDAYRVDHDDAAEPGTDDGEPDRRLDDGTLAASG